VLPFTAETAVKEAELRAQLESKGEGIGPMDLLIAATALDYDLPIVSGNLAEFSRVASLRVSTWSK
jgi:tRNA(fMet)-specific endonuclease VapC